VTYEVETVSEWLGVEANSAKMNVKGRVYDYVERIWMISERVNFVNCVPVNGGMCAW